MSSSQFRDDGVPASQRKIPVIGIVGGIGSGKSTVARWVDGHANVRVIDADKLGHEVLLDANVKAALKSHFGEAIFDSQGNVDRKTLALRVFGDSGPQRADRKSLEQIVHPEIAHRISAQITDAEQSGRIAVILDAAVLFEAGWENKCHAIVFIDVPDDIRAERVFHRSGWTVDELRRREASQMSLSEKRSRSQKVISNTGDVSVAGQELLNFLLHR